MATWSFKPIFPISTFVVLLCVLFCPAAVLGQHLEAEAPAVTGKTFPLTFGLDVGLFLHQAGYAWRYEGEYFRRTIDDQGEWEWAKLNKDVSFNRSRAKLRSFDMYAELMPWNRLTVGLNYHMIAFVDREPGISSASDYTYAQFSILGLFGYDYLIPKAKGLFVLPQFGIGVYQSDDFFSGKGRELAFKGKVSIGYRVKEKFGFHYYLAYNGFHYKYRSESNVFGKMQTDKVVSGVFHSGIGLSYRFHITPD